MKALLEQLLVAAVRKLVGTLVSEMPERSLVTVERTRDAAHGEFASNIAMRLANTCDTDPVDLAQAIVKMLPQSPVVSRAEVAGPGFINFFLARDAFAREIRRIHEQGDAYGRSSVGAGKRVVVQFVSASPKQPLDVQQGRCAAYAEALANLLAAAGYDVHREDAMFNQLRDSGNAPKIQSVTLFRGSERVEAGEIATYLQLCHEVGEDACRFFYLMRSHEQHLDFDLKLAKLRTNENPLFCVQYAHARAASAMKEVRARGMSFDLAAGLRELALLDKDTEQALIALLLRFPERVATAAANCAPHSIVYYLREVAHAFHTYYNAEKWIVEEADLRNARLALVLAARQVIRNGLALLGVSTPESM